ncbi:MAG: LCP family protein, partial [Clostridia bacterium]|nr:LCP family protein [Clostridia bacterium]
VEIGDAVGGVEVELTPAEIHYTNAGIAEIARVRGLKPTYVSKSGKQLMNGLQAVSFSRIRYVPTINGTRDDYGRTERQRLVMSRLFEKALDLPLTQYPSLIRTILPYVQTSLGYDDIFKLAKVLKADGVSMQQGRIPVDESVITGGLSVPHIGSCVYYDLEYSADLLNAFFFEDITFEAYMAQHGVWKHNWYGASGYGDVYIHPDGTVEKGPIKGGSTTNTSSSTQSSSGSDFSDLTTDTTDITDTDSDASELTTEITTDSSGGTTDTGNHTDPDVGSSEDLTDSSENSETEDE